jgi:hypothetical protein
MQFRFRPTSACDAPLRKIKGYVGRGSRMQAGCPIFELEAFRSGGIPWRGKSVALGL